ncbi:PKD-like family lipoprotein [Chitinophaga tropicalis]|uniref:PKD family protein n=1 Tax=Chitinophaga tropicalis TaxID=2683588 RepID=A0A7K1U376_9BACT|nr:PKD-like family lipoprotein [Chitinophaga tropicalis]MVT08809.1 hypothetical protein [Chitinophaga tropicalis]
MTTILSRYKYLLLAGLFFLTLQACYKDKGNYDYAPLPPVVVIDTNSYLTSYTKVYTVDSLIIDPVISYSGNIEDLSYEWQMWDNSVGRFVHFQQGKRLAYKVGADQYVKATGIYNLRLGVSNRSLKSDTADPDAAMTYSRIVTMTVVTANYIGLMVLHGDGTQCDVGLIEDNFFMPKATQTVTTKVTPGFYSSFNNGEKIPGVGKQVEKVGVVSTFGSSIFGTSNVYIFTDKVNIRTAYLRMEKLGDYSALFALPSLASGKPGYYTQFGTNQSKAMVDDGRVFYGNFVGPLSNTDFTYYAAPYVALVGSAGFTGGPSRGVVAFDTISKAFLYSTYGSGTTNINKFPDNTVSGVDLQPNNMKAKLVYMDIRGRTYNTLAVLKDATTGNDYLAEFNFWATDASQVSVGKYPMENLPGYGSIKFYAFGRELNMVYYATGNTLYQYLYQGGNTASAIYTVPSGEEITGVKVIKYEYAATSTTYQYSNKQMVIATVDQQGKGKVYAFSVNTVTGATTLKKVFDGFGQIYDMSVKDQ